MQDLIRELKSELSGHFEDVVIALMMKPTEYECHELRESVKVLLLERISRGRLYIVSDPDPRKIEKEGLAHRPGWKCTLRPV